MKKTMLFIILLFAGLEPLIAGVVPQEKARRTAESFVASLPRTKAGGGSLSLAWSLPSASKGGDNLIYAYEISNAGGYVIVSGDDAVGPVLGYSPAGRFPGADMPDGMKWLMDYYGYVVSMAREKGWATSSAEAVFDPSKKVKLQTAPWGQLSPYNAECPDIYSSGSRPPAGCVATAIGIIMNYHRWPEKGQGTIPAYSYTMEGTTYHIDGVTLGHRYDWDAMNAAEPDYGEIAKLLHEIGVMTEMMYLGSGSGTSATYATRLAQYFGYDKGIIKHERYVYTDARFEGIIKAEIDAKRPLLYNAYNAYGGHSMVIDGYCGRYFSINFGYEGKPVRTDGYSDPLNEGAWFLITPVEGHEKDMAAYANNQFIMCNIKPDAGGGTAQFGQFSNGRVALPYDFAPGKPFTVYNSLFSSVPAESYMVLMDASGNVKEKISEVHHMPGKNEWLFGWDSFPNVCTVHSSLKDGDQILVAMYIDGKMVPVEITRKSVFIFGKKSPSDGLLVGYVTGNETNPMNSFLEQALRDGKRWNVREYWEDFFYFRCYKDLVWQIIDMKDGSVQWDSGDYANSDEKYGEKPRFASLFQEDYFYNFIRLKKGEYQLKIKNPLTGEALALDIVI